MSSAYKKALEKKKTAQVSLFDEEKGRDESSSESEHESDDSQSVKQVPT